MVVPGSKYPFLKYSSFKRVNEQILIVLKPNASQIPRETKASEENEEREEEQTNKQRGKPFLRAQ